jgi:DNA gyrase subunit A
VNEIRETGRNAAGVKLINLDDGDKLVAMARVDKAEEEAVEDGATEGGETPSPDAPASDAPSA